VHPIGFTTEIYYDVRSYKSQKIKRIVFVFDEQ